MKKTRPAYSSMGVLLQEQFLQPLNLSQSELARALHVPRARISDMIQGKRAVTADTDLRLCRYFGLEEGYFLSLQERMLLARAKQKIDGTLKKIRPRADFKKTTLPAHGAQNRSTHRLQIGLICGGPSRERGISLNSARSVMDHLDGEAVEIHPFYVDHFKNFYSVSKSQLYSNTPSDFDFKLAHAATRLSGKKWVAALQKMDLIFPVIHGAFGEDGELQELLEKERLPFVGSNSKACRRMFHKFEASKILSRHGYATLPSILLREGEPGHDGAIRAFFKKHQLKRAIVKPVAGGSSIGVFSAYTAEEAIEKSHRLFEMKIDPEILVEPFCQGKEFTIILFQNVSGEPVALIPSEIQVSYDKGEFFDYRRKYLPTANTKWPCPPHFEDALIEKIQRQAEEIFTLFGMRDFARLDGWVLPDGQILFTDLNPISGMEQNSFIFQQSSRIGMTHCDTLWNIVRKACLREKIDCPIKQPIPRDHTERLHSSGVRVLFGGSTAERQVSLMSGTNIWLKLLRSKRYTAEPYFLDQKGAVWKLGYAYALNHTVEEIYDNCLTAAATADRLEKLARRIRARLDSTQEPYDVRAHLPQKYSFEKFLEESKKEGAFIFLGLHGGEGENGVIQQKLDEAGLLYNGSGPAASELCMDKYLTGEAVSKMGDSSILTAPKKQIRLTHFASWKSQHYQQYWEELKEELQADTFIVKPQHDGCSAGVVRLYKAADLEKYIRLVSSAVPCIPAGTFTHQHVMIEMPQEAHGAYMIEAFIETDVIRIQKNDLIYKQKTGWLELTAGVLESHGSYHALNPSITIAEGAVLSLEEKFQGGTGINVTPPPEAIISKRKREKIKTAVCKIAQALGIENYARIDIFYNVLRDNVLVIEANTLPGLTPSTVIYHQALAEEEPMPPTAFLEKIISLKMEKHQPANSMLECIA